MNSRSTAVCVCVCVYHCVCGGGTQFYYGITVWVTRSPSAMGITTHMTVTTGSNGHRCPVCSLCVWVSSAQPIHLWVKSGIFLHDELHYVATVQSLSNPGANMLASLLHCKLHYIYTAVCGHPFK
jgi:hypothetical protein